jgi:hypothetical protein
LWLLATAFSGMDVGVLGFSRSSLLQNTPSLSQKRALPSYSYTIIESLSSRRFQASRNAQTFPFRTSLGLSSDNEDGDDNDEEASGESFVSRLFIASPFLSAIFPILLVVALSFPERSSEQFAVVAVLFGANRLYLYLLSTIIVALAALRGSRDDARPGQRLVGLTEELLYSPSLEKTRTSNDKEKSADGTVKKPNAFASSPALIQSLSTELGDSLDTVSTGTQAVVLPLLVSALLASSVFFLQISGDGSPPTIPSESLDLLSSFQDFLPFLSKLWTFALLTLFTRCEVRRLSFQLNLVKDKEWIYWLVGVGITAVAYLGVWPAQNVCNMALACLIARGIQITRFPAIVAALAALTVYDAASVLLLQPAFAASIDSITAAGTTVLSDSAGVTLVAAGDTTGVASSAMGAVAMNKLTSAYFQPGLLVTRIGSNLGGALGLGDAVFPAILAIFAKRYDRGVQNDVNAPTISLFATSMVGYVVGCLACELVPFLSTTGVPALLLIAPSMLLSVVGVASIRGEVEALWNFDPVQEEEDSDLF